MILQKMPLNLANYIASKFIIVRLDLSTFKNKTKTCGAVCKATAAILSLATSFSILLDWRQIYSKSKSHKNVFFNILLETILQKLIQWKIFGCWQSVRIFRKLKTVKISNEMPNWRRQINKIDRQYSPQIRAFLKGMTSPKLILMLEIE